MRTPPPERVNLDDADTVNGQPNTNATTLVTANSRGFAEPCPTGSAAANTDCITGLEGSNPFGNFIGYVTVMVPHQSSGFSAANQFLGGSIPELLIAQGQ